MLIIINAKNILKTGPKLVYKGTQILQKLAENLQSFLQNCMHRNSMLACLSVNEILAPMDARTKATCTSFNFVTFWFRCFSIPHPPSHLFAQLFTPALFLYLFVSLQTYTVLHPSVLTPFSLSVCVCVCPLSSLSLPVAMCLVAWSNWRWQGQRERRGEGGRGTL